MAIVCLGYKAYNNIMTHYTQLCGETYFLPAYIGLFKFYMNNKLLKFVASNQNYLLNLF